MRAISLFAAGATILPALVSGTPLKRDSAQAAPHFVVYQDGKFIPSRENRHPSLIYIFISLGGWRDRSTSHVEDCRIQHLVSYLSLGLHSPRPDSEAFYSILSFLLINGPADQATQWASLDAATRASTKSAYDAAGIKLMVSAFGSTDTPASSKADPVGTGNSMASWVKNNNLDGIDVDFEDFAAVKYADSYSY